MYVDGRTGANAAGRSAHRDLLYRFRLATAAGSASAAAAGLERASARELGRPVAVLPGRGGGRGVAMRRALTRMVIAASFAAVAACGGGPSGSSSDAQEFSVLTTTPVLAALTGLVTDDVIGVRSVMPATADPHDYQPSAQDRRRMQQAGLLVVNGGGLEESLLTVIDQASGEGVPTLIALEAVSPLRYPDGSLDPHFWLDPRRAGALTRSIADRLAQADPAHAGTYQHNAAAAVADLNRLEAQVQQIVAPLPAETRKLVVNHDAYRYFADRFGFEVLGTIVPGRSSQAAPSTAHLAELADLMRKEHICAVFSDVTGSDAWARSLASEVGPGTSVVALYGATLPEGSYPQLLLTDATRIATALAACPTPAG